MKMKGARRLKALVASERCERVFMLQVPSVFGVDALVHGGVGKKNLSRNMCYCSWKAIDRRRVCI